MKEKKRRRGLILLIAFLIITVIFLILRPKAPQSSASVKSISELEDYLEQLTDFGIPPGMTLVVVKDDSIIYSKGFGWADQPQKIRAESETVYHWFSITKIVTAIAVLQLQEQGKLNLDDSVVKYLPFFKVKYPSSTSKVITLRNLLNHSSGLPDPKLRLLKWIHYKEDTPVNQTALVKKVFPDYSELKFEPGEKFTYSNFGYMVLGAVIEQVTNLNYEDYVRESILKPLEMEHTDFIYTEEMESCEAIGTQPVIDIITPFVCLIKGPIVRDISGKNIWFNTFYNDQTPPTGLIGSATDAAHLAISCLNGGKYCGQRILTDGSVNTMTYESHVNLSKNDKNDNQEQGIGWRIYNHKEGLMLEHTGGGLAFHTVMRLYPEKKLGFILFSNSTKRKAQEIIDLAATLNWMIY